MSSAMNILTGSTKKTSENARKYYEDNLLAWGIKESLIDEGITGVPLSQKMRTGTQPAERFNETDAKGYSEEWTEKLEGGYGVKNPFLLASAAGQDYEVNGRDSIKALDDMAEKAAVDSSTVQSASPIAVDPLIVDTQRSRAPVLSRIMQEAQPGFTAQYNVIDSRNAPVGMISESDAADLSDNTEGDFGLTTASKDMKIYADQVNISDFAQRAEQTLGYMDLAQTTLGQRVVEHALFKAKQIFYGDPSVGASDGSVEDSNAYEGLNKIAVDAGNDLDKSGTTSGFLEDIKSELTSQVENSGLTYDNAEIFVSSDMFDTLENEAQVHVRLDSFDGNVNFGGRQLSVKGVPVTECPNIRGYGGLSGTNFASDNGDVFIVDRSAVRFRALAPLSTLGLGRTGLADKAAMFEYGTLIDKSNGEHTLALDGYDI